MHRELDVGGDFRQIVTFWVEESNPLVFPCMSFTVVDCGDAKFI